ncbi:MAG: cysteine--tRNA ligase [Bacilli bacterium]|nr:cysteine--tRNA ligase [Bacilli bacterium]
MKVFNSLTNKVEPFKTKKENEANIYVCGPTVYSYVHVGNLRPVVVFDVFRRFLKYVGYKVTFVSNYTDVDDKIINACQKTGQSEKELTDFYIQEFEKDLKNINSMVPDVTPRVTEYMDKIIDFINELVKKGAAYVVDGDVYFRVNSVKDYGVLSNTNIDDLLVGARIDENSKKESPLDFTLWKKTEVGVKWQSPWSLGRPGWHTECVVMINSLFEDGHIDVHGGGFDLKFPHHENEIAQSMAYHDHKIASYWMHNGFININNEKMSKSLGNVKTAHEAIDTFGAMPVRLLLISTHYRAPVNFADDILASNAKEINKMQMAYKQLAVKLQLLGVELKEDDKASNIDEFLNAIADDLNTSNALADLYLKIKEANQLIRTNPFDTEAGYQKFLQLKDMFYILGLNIQYPLLNAEDKKLYNEYNEAKANKDFEKSDLLRNTLIEKGIL